MNPYQVVKDFERALCEYTGAPYAVTTTSCTMALLLAVGYQLRLHPRAWLEWARRPAVEIPKRTYVGVPMAIVHAGGRPAFRDEDWIGMYQLYPLPVWDSARLLTAGMYYGAMALENDGVKVRGVLMPGPGNMLCLSFHWSKTLGIQQGGAILHDNPVADRWLRRARFDGRSEGVAPANDAFPILGWHCYMAPETAAAGLVRLANMPRDNAPLPNDDYPDLSKMEVFQ